MRGIGQTVGVMGESRRIHHDRGLLVGGLVHPADHLGFVIALTHFHVKTKLAAPLRAQGTQGFKILLAIHVRLTHAKTTKIRPIDDHYFSHIPLPYLVYC